MPSITYWNRLEPRARSNDLAGALAARVRDPAWFLARQWQFGEFQGEDAGAPAYVNLNASVTRVVGWRAGAMEETAGVGDGQPIEHQALSEPFSTTDLSTIVDLGMWFERIMTQASLGALIPYWREAFAIQDATGDDPRSARLRALWKGRAIDGLALYLAAKVAPEPPPAPPPGVPLTVPSGSWSSVADALQNFTNFVEASDMFLGKLGSADPVSWQPERLDHSLSAYVAEPDGEGDATMKVLRATPDSEGELEWFAFDETSDEVPEDVSEPSVETVSRQVIPGPVRFRGMPNARFWDFEDGRVDFGGIQPDRRDLLSMALMEFMLVHGNDWFLVPFEQSIGTRTRFTQVKVVDVFGVETVVDQAQSIDAGAPDKRWTMFSTTSGDGVCASLFLPATVASSVIDGEVREEVRFLRDETANLAWAVERTTESHLGRGWSGHERDVADAPRPQEVTGLAPLVYDLQTRVPTNWIPFQAVKAGNGIALKRSKLLGPEGAVNPPAMGKILNPESVGDAYLVREEEIPREGRRVSRLARWARDVDGHGLLWMARKRSIGTGEGWSGLRFDTALSATVVTEEPSSTMDWDESPGWNDSNWG